MLKESKKTNNGIFSLDKSKDVVDIKNEIVYTILGNQDKLVNKFPVLLGENVSKSELAYAKKVTIGKKETYYVKVDNLGHLFNPIQIDRQITLKSKLLKGETIKFIKVSDICFGHYLNFLKTKNVLFLKHASRER